MLSGVVRVADVVHLEAERVLQVVARLLIGQSGHDGRPVGDVDDDQAATVGHALGHFVQLR